MRLQIRDIGALKLYIAVCDTSIDSVESLLASGVNPNTRVIDWDPMATVKGYELKKRGERLLNVANRFYVWLYKTDYLLVLSEAATNGPNNSDHTHQH